MGRGYGRGNDLGLARQRLQRRMRDGEGQLAEELCSTGWSTVVDGPLNNIRRTRAVPIVGYVKTHHRRLLDPVEPARVPGRLNPVGAPVCSHRRRTLWLLPADWRCRPVGLAVGGNCALGGPACGRQAAIDALDAASSWLPQYASAAHRDKRAPVNLIPIAGLETQLRRRAGDARLALRAVRDAIIQLNTPGGL